MRKFLFENLISLETGFPVIVTHDNMSPREDPNNEEDRKIAEIERKIEKSMKINGENP